MITTAAIDAFANYPQLTERENHRLIRRVKLGDTNAEDKLIRHSAKLLCKAMNSLSYPPEMADDLYQEGQIGLREAARSYRFELDTKWSARAFVCARRDMINMLNDPKHRPVSRIHALAIYNTPAFYLHIDGLEDELFSVCDRIAIEKHLCVLDRRQQAVITYYFGLGGPRMTLKEISQLMDLSLQRVHQIRNHSLKELHDSMNHPQPLSA